MTFVATTAAILYSGARPVFVDVDPKTFTLDPDALFDEPEVADLKGTVEPTVDRTRHVNGGCRSLTSDGRAWQCYIGSAAVDEQIVSADFLGEYMPSPGVG